MRIVLGLAIAGLLLAHAPVSAQVAPAPAASAPPMPSPTAAPSPAPMPTPSSAPSPVPAPSTSPSPAPSASAAVLVPAGVIPAAVDVVLTGHPTPEFVLAHIRAAIDALAHRQPGTLMDVHGITIDANLAPGTTLDADAGVTLAGRGVALDVQGRTHVRVRVADLPPFDPALLWYSDDPEYVPAGVDGALFLATLQPDTPARVFLYHVAAGTPRRVSLVLEANGAPAEVQRVAAATGPSPAYAYVGQQTTARFLLAHALQEGTLLDLAPGVPLEIPIASLQPGDLIESIDDLRVVSGGPVSVAVVTAASPADLTTLAAGPELPDDTHGRRGVFSLADVAPVDLSWSATAPAPADPVDVGGGTIPNLRPDGRPLAGDYGVLRRITLHLANPTADPQTVSLYVRTIGGSATTTLLFDGEPAATLAPCVNDANTPRLVRAFVVPPNTTQTIAGSYMTDGASSYPIELGLTSAPVTPIPPGACGPS